MSSQELNIQTLYNAFAQDKSHAVTWSGSGLGASPHGTSPSR